MADVVRLSRLCTFLKAVQITDPSYPYLSTTNYQGRQSSYMGSNSKSYPKPLNKIQFPPPRNHHHPKKSRRDPRILNPAATGTGWTSARTRRRSEHGGRRRIDCARARDIGRRRLSQYTYLFVAFYYNLYLL